MRFSLLPVGAATLLMLADPVSVSQALARKVAFVRTQALSAGGSQWPIDLKRRARQAILQFAT